MTGIVWDGEILVADKATFFGEQRVLTKKAIVVNGYAGRLMIALCGSLTAITKLQKHFNSPEWTYVDVSCTDEERHHCFGIAIDQNKLAHHVFIDGTLSAALPPGPLADGSAMEFLMGAVTATNSAEQAMELALKWRSDVGLGYDKLVWADVFDNGIEGAPWPAQPSYEGA